MKVIKSSIEIVTLLSASVAIAQPTPQTSTESKPKVVHESGFKDFRKQRNGELNLSIYEKPIFSQARIDIRGQ